MLKLRTLLLCNYPFYILLILSLLYSLVIINVDTKSIYLKDQTLFFGYVEKVEKNKIVLKSKEKLLIHTEEKFSVGDFIKIKGSLKEPKDNSIFNTFNYKKHLKQKKIFWILYPEEITKINRKIPLKYKMVRAVTRQIEKSKSKEYLYTFILGNKSYLDENIYKSFQKNGISHLLAISGMHISFFALMLLSILKKLSKIKRYLITIIFLFIYISLTGFSISATRSFFMFVLFFINDIYYFHIKPRNILLFLFSVFLFINPYILNNIGFQFSFLITFFIILNFKKISNTNNYIKKLIYTSLISLAASLPILINNFYEVNFIALIINLLFIPYVTFIMFPLTLLTLIFPFLDPLLGLIIIISEKLTLMFSSIDILTVIFRKSLIVILYPLLLLCFSKTNKKRYLALIFVVLLIHSTVTIKTPYIISIDVENGDSTLIHFKDNTNILIDTGGNYETFSEDKIIPMLKSYGIKKLDLLVITHGDYDHIGNAQNLINNFKVNKIVLNSNEKNDLENNIYKDNVITLKKNKEYIINNKVKLISYKASNENDSSIITYLLLNNKKILLTGDISKSFEEKYIDETRIKNIDILKVSHHGSSSSSSKYFLKKLSPNYCNISVGENNKYNHPSPEVLKDLKNYCKNVYQTSKHGSIKYIFKNDNIIIETIDT